MCTPQPSHPDAWPQHNTFGKHIVCRFPNGQHLSNESAHQSPAIVTDGGNPAEPPNALWADLGDPVVDHDKERAEPPTLAQLCIPRGHGL